MKIHTINCPNCGGKIEFNTGTPECVCQYCDSTVLIENNHVKGNPQTAGQKPASAKGCLISLIVLIIFILAIGGMITIISRFISARSRISEATRSEAKVVIIQEDWPSFPSIPAPPTISYAPTVPSTPAASSHAPAKPSVPASSSAPAPKKVTVTLPKTPQTLSYTINATSTVFTKTTVNSITQEQLKPSLLDDENEVRIKLTLKCKKVHDRSGDKGTNMATFRLVVKNKAGEIIDTKHLFKMMVSNNQVFTLDCELVLTANESYVIELDDFTA